MKKLSKPVLTRIIVYALLVLALLVVAQFLNSYFLQIIIYIFMFAYFASAWNILSGFAGQFSLGHAIFIGVGAYTSTILYVQYGVSPWIGMLAGGLLAAILGVIIGLPCFKLQSTYFTLTTIALANIMLLAVQSIRNIGPVQINAARGIMIPAIDGNNFWMMQFVDKKYYLYIILVFLGILLALCQWIKTSKMGYQLAAVANNQDAAESLCVNSRMLKLKAMAISAFMCGIGGTFYAQLILVCNPARLFAEALSDKLAIVAMLGGKGLVFGPTVGALIVESISQFATANFANVQGLNLTIYGVMLIVCIRFFPDGILPILQRLVKKIFRKKEKVAK
ncbi:MAG TPA: branched-chain amino acid ABC transporter permease [Clostridiales bacterium]|nr:branched-chain amino acid ABC transporter permease [Clostridiales bacterium]